MNELKDLSIDRDSGGLPLYRQLAEQIAARIRDGRLAPGDRLPTVRKLAEDLGLTRLTVHRAFRDLQAGGWIEATVGRGTFVRHREPQRQDPAPAGARVTADSVMADIQKFGRESGMVNMAHAEPDPDLIPADAFWDCLLALRHDAASHAQYISPQGDAALRERLATHVKSRGIIADPSEILVTSGVTQGLSLISQALARPGDRVVVERPTYLGLLHILQAQGLVPVGVTLDDEGPALDQLERIVDQERPRFFYTIATFHNPTGRSMSARRRKDLIALARRRQLSIVEDDIYHLLSYDGALPPSLKSLDHDGRVIYLDGLSKAVLPGVRSGYAIAPAGIMERLLSLRRAQDLCGPSVIQRALVEFMKRGQVGRHIRKVLPEYRRRRDAIMVALKRWMPAGVEWTRPEGGFSTWITIADLESPAELYAAARERGLVFAPGDVFLTGPVRRAHMRLCFGRLDAVSIRKGVELLAGLIRERVGSSARSPSHPVPDLAPLV